MENTTLVVGRPPLPGRADDAGAACLPRKSGALVVMPVNQTRGTPGLLLLIFACALLLTAANGWKLRREAREIVSATALTDVGDDKTLR